MMSSRDPGELGFYGFRNRKDHSYDGYAFASSAQVKVPRLWDWLGQAGSARWCSACRRPIPRRA